jgi:type I restriction enzyme M protein
VTQEDFADFLACFQPGESREAREPGERFRPYSYEELSERDKTGLDIFWLSDSSLAGANSALAPKVIAREIADEIRAALEEFDAIAEALPDNDEANGANLGDEERRK